MNSCSHAAATAGSEFRGISRGSPSINASSQVFQVGPPRPEIPRLFDVLNRLPQVVLYQIVLECRCLHIAPDASRCLRTYSGVNSQLKSHIRQVVMGCLQPGIPPHSLLQLLGCFRRGTYLVQTIAPVIADVGCVESELDSDGEVRRRAPSQSGSALSRSGKPYSPPIRRFPRADSRGIRLRRTA